MDGGGSGNQNDFHSPHPSKPNQENNLKFRKVTNCRVCGSDDLFTYLDLPDSPPCNRLTDGIQEVEKFELKLMLCKNCFLSQLSIAVDPNELYSDYVYHSSVSKTFQKHCFEMASEIKANFSFKNDPPSCMDIAANDGCLLREFLKHGFVCRGYEPCLELARYSWKPEENRFIHVIPAFFNLRHSLRGRSWSGEDVITATNVLAHVDDVIDFIFGVKFQMDYNPRSIFVVEVPHLLNLIKGNQFDTVYHEHLSYFLMRPLLNLFSKCGLEIFKVEKHPIHGGSLRLYAGHPGVHPTDSSVVSVIDEEEKAGMYDLKTYIDFAVRTLRVAADVQIIMNFTEMNGKKVMGYGASAKGISLINYLGIRNQIHSIVDETPEKQGKFTPHSNIQIVDFSHFEKEKPDYIFLLAWNFKEELIEKTKHLGAKYIVPIPEPVIV